MQAAKLLGASGTASKLYAEDVFSAYTYIGNGSTQTITNGIDLSGSGGMVWIKSRSANNIHSYFDTVRGATKLLRTGTDATAAETTVSDTLTAFTSSGFTLGADAGNWGVNKQNTSPYAQVAWTFRKAPKFFDVVTYAGNSAVTRNIAHSLGQAPGMVIVKRTDTVSTYWTVWHRSDPTAFFKLNSTDGRATAGASSRWGGTISMNASTFSVGDTFDVNASGGTYVAYLFAHDTATDGLIQCGSYVGNGSATGPTITLGFEPQFLLVKATAATADPSTNNWFMADVAREMSMTNTVYLLSNANNPEGTGNNLFNPTATGFKISSAAQGINNSGTTYVYLAIRRPNKPPTTGTQVYNAIARTGTGAAATVTGVGFAPDACWAARRDGASETGRWDRLRGVLKGLRFNTDLEFSATTDGVAAFGMDGCTYGGATEQLHSNGMSLTYINHFFKRAPGVLSQICYSGTGANKTESHDLGVAPELWLVKGRSGATQWVWGSSLLANTEKIVMPTPAGKVTDATAWNSTYPTSSVLSLGTAAAVNTNAATYTAYLWATKAGISKVFSYTGNGSSQNIDCGFTTGARFILIVRTSAAGSVYIWDTVRGIVAGNDPYLALDTTAAEVTTDDSVDPLTSGFSVNQVAATNINVTGATYIGLAYS